ncbi:MAG: hypothetical protein ABIS06_20455 [Vicinamibacterales bacterium]
MPELINTHDDRGALSSTPKPLASWYAQGLSDGLGDRLLMFDNSDAPSLELLRFRSDFAQVPGFEAALRDRVQRLAHFRDPAFARVRSVQRLEPDHDLALISNCTPGKRLSEVLHHMRGPAVAAALIQQLGPALAQLQQHDNGIGHGVLSPARVVVSPEGRLTIVEHVIGPAIDALDLRTDQLAALGIALPPAGNGATPTLDIASDWYQLGLVAVSVLLGRQLTAGELPEVDTLLDRAARLKGRGDTTVLSPFMREWLARALQISGSRIESGAEAGETLDELLRKEQSRDVRRIESSRPDTLADTSVRPAAPPAQEVTAPSRADADPELVPLAPFPTEREANNELSAEEAWKASRSQQERARARIERPQPVAVQSPRDRQRLAVTKHVETIANRPAAVRESSAPATPRPAVAPRRPVSSIVLAALALTAAVEAGIIGGLARALWLTPGSVLVVETKPSGDNVVVNPDAGDAPPLGIAVAPDLRWVRVTTPSQAGVLGGKMTAISTGTIAISSPIELKVIEGSRLLGSVPGAALKLPVGRHDLELVNELLGYRLPQSVEVEGGQTLSLHVAPAPGMVTIDAVPWADVSIDGQPVGRTPLGPLPLMPGVHTIVFKHPAGGTDNQRVIVKSDARIRVVGKLTR